ncbi:MAG: hypothetical protein COC01_01055 [Bacteroidetes bacterium]|nr:MAG: hypothetical protein COC01_01055 [Bacteroidota bacterium]
MRKLLGFILILIIAGIGGIIGVGVYDYSLSKYFRETETTSFDEKQNVVFTKNQSGFPDEQSAGVNFTYASSIATPAVVHIKSIVQQHTTQGYNFDPFRDFFGFRFYDQRPQTQPRQRMSSGSGVIISEDGYIVSNNHVINGADEIEIVLNDKRTFSASVIGTDPTTDLALLKVEEKGLPFLKFGNSDNIQVGEWVLAVGNPFNLTSTVTAGIVSAKARSINILDDKYRIESFIQTDAVVNPGNSGGALINTLGDLVGINTAIQSQTGSYIGYSFAIPVNIVKKVMDDLLKYGKVQRGFIGVSIRDIDAALAKELNLNKIEGVYVADLTPGGSAEDAGIQKGDVILKVNGVAVNSASELQEQVGRFRPGDRVAIVLNSDGDTEELNVILRNKEGTTSIIKREKKEIMTVLGAEFEELSENEKREIGLTHGVKIKRLKEGKLRYTGLREGFIITHINKRSIESPQDIAAIFKKNKGNIVGIEGFYPDDGTKYYYGFSI